MMNEVSKTLLEVELIQNPSPRLRPGKKQLNQIANPMINKLADSLGMSAQSAKMVVGYVVIVLQTVVEQNCESERDVFQLGRALENLLKTDFAYRSGMADRLSRATGLTEDEAAFSLERAMTLINDQYIFN